MEKPFHMGQKIVGESVTSKTQPVSIPSAGYYSWNRVGFRFEVIYAWKWSFSKDERIGSAKVTNCAAVL